MSGVRLACCLRAVDRWSFILCSVTGVGLLLSVLSPSLQVSSSPRHFTTNSSRIPGVQHCSRSPVSQAPAPSCTPVAVSDTGPSAGHELEAEAEADVYPAQTRVSVSWPPPCPFPVGSSNASKAPRAPGAAVTPLDLLTTRPAGSTWRQRQQLSARRVSASPTSVAVGGEGRSLASVGVGVGAGIGVGGGNRLGVGGALSPVARRSRTGSETDCITLEECKEASSVGSSDKSAATAGGFSAASSLASLSSSQGGGTALYSSEEGLSAANRRMGATRSDSEDPGSLTRWVVGWLRACVAWDER